MSDYGSSKSFSSVGESSGSSFATCEDYHDANSITIRLGGFSESRDGDYVLPAAYPPPPPQDPPDFKLNSLPDTYIEVIICSSFNPPSYFHVYFSELGHVYFQWGSPFPTGDPLPIGHTLTEAGGRTLTVISLG